MPQPLPFSFGPDSNPARARQFGNGQLVNAFAEPVSDGKNGAKYAIYNDPGLLAFCTTAEANTRGSFLIGTTLYAVLGENLYKISAGGSATLIGVVSGTRPVIVAVNNNGTAKQAAIVADTKVYELQADVLIPWADPDLATNVVSVDFMDGFFLFLLSTGVFQKSGPNNTTIDPLDFIEAERRADGGVRGVNYEGKFWVIGRATVEIFSNTGAAGFPFRRDDTFIERGGLAKMTVVAFDNTLCFVDDLGRMIKLVGYTPTVFSNTAVELDIRRTMNAQVTDALEAFVWATAGHEFLVLSGHDWTWVFDSATQFWHRKNSYGSTRWKGRNYIRAFDRHLVGSNDTGKLYTMSLDYFDEDGAFLIVDLISAPLGPWEAVVEWQFLDIDMEMGAGLNTALPHAGQPQAMLSHSDDGGNSWSLERLVAIGPLAEYRTRMRETRLGQSNGRARMWRLRISAPIRRAFIEGLATIEVAAA